MPPLHKEKHIYLEPYLNWVRSLRCYFCSAPAPSYAHHWPPKGIGGARIDDTKTVPVCLICHKRAHGERVMTPLGLRVPLTGADNVAAVDATLRRFIREAPRELLDVYADAMTEWRQARGL